MIFKKGWTRSCAEGHHGWCSGRTTSRPFYWSWRKCWCICHSKP